MVYVYINVYLVLLSLSLLLIMIIIFNITYIYIYILHNNVASTRCQAFFLGPAGVPVDQPISPS